MLERKVTLKPTQKGSLGEDKKKRTPVEPASDLITFRDPKSKRTDGRARFTAAAHHATSSVNQAAGFISNRYSQMQEAEGRHIFVGPEDPKRIDTHRGGSVYRCDEEADVFGKKGLIARLFPHVCVASVTMNTN